MKGMEPVHTSLTIHKKSRLWPWVGPNVFRHAPVNILTGERLSMRGFVISNESWFTRLGDCPSASVLTESGRSAFDPVSDIVLSDYPAQCF